MTKLSIKKIMEQPELVGDTNLIFLTKKIWITCNEKFRSVSIHTQLPPFPRAFLLLFSYILTMIFIIGILEHVFIINCVYTFIHFGKIWQIEKWVFHIEKWILHIIIFVVTNWPGFHTWYITGTKVIHIVTSGTPKK